MRTTNWSKIENSVPLFYRSKKTKSEHNKRFGINALKKKIMKIKSKS